MGKIDDIRKKIDQLDSNTLELLNRGPYSLCK